MRHIRSFSFVLLTAASPILWLAPSPTGLANDAPKQDDEQHTNGSPTSTSKSAQNNQEIAHPLLRAIAFQQIATTQGDPAPEPEPETDQHTNQKHSIAIGPAVELVQQSSMAVGTSVMAGAAVVALIFNAWGILLLYKNLIEARKTTRAAQDAANAANLQAQQNRAWVGIVDMPVFSVVNRGVGITLRIANLGFSPATDIDTEIGIMDMINQPKHSIVQASNWGYLGQSQTLDVSCKFDTEIFHIVGHKAFCEVVIAYRTIHGDTAKTRSVFLIEIERGAILNDGIPAMLEGTKITTTMWGAGCTTT